MKTRNGFVSNSSSSSFVVLGAQISEEELRKLGWYSDEMGPETGTAPKGVSIYYYSMDKKREYIVGQRLCDSDENCGLDYAEWPLDKLNVISKEMEVALNRPVKLIMGTRPT